MKSYHDKKRFIIQGKKYGMKIEWGKLRWFGAAVRRDPAGFTLNLFFWWALFISFQKSDALHQETVEIRTWGGMIVPNESVVIWQWGWNGGGSELHKDGIFKQWAYGDMILGEPVFKERTLGTFLREMEMPEATYKLEVTVDEGSWKRPRSPFTRRVWRAKIQVADGGEIPVPMPEGEEDSATYGETRNDTKTPLPTRIVEAYKRDLMEERRIVGGSYDWRAKS